jgi:hypothetical protein
MIATEGWRRPRMVVHVDWGRERRKRVAAQAMWNGQRYEVATVEEFLGVVTYFDALDALEDHQTALFGFDFCIGVPQAWAAVTGGKVKTFPEFLRSGVKGYSGTIFRPASEKAEISIERPFYPDRPGGKSQADLKEKLKLSRRELYRHCDWLADASPLFWTLGSKQVGKGSLTGWAEVIIPLLRDPFYQAGLWPFDGHFKALLGGGNHLVLCETYPRAFQEQRGLDDLPKSGIRKGDPTLDRAVEALAGWINELDVQVTDRGLLKGSLETFRDDGFDAWAGLLGLIDTLRAGTGIGLDVEWPEEFIERLQIEGWMVGLPWEAAKGVAGT